MAETKWPKGPWTYSLHDGLVFADDGTGITDVDTAAVDDEATRDAIGQLIAAAPELYDALDNMTSIAAGLAILIHGKKADDPTSANFLDREYPSIRAAMNLLAKARGEA